MTPAERRTLPLFGGETYDPKLDKGRLSTLLGAVRDYMLRHGRYKTLAEIAKGIAISGTEASISARLRDLRKKQHGGFIVDRQRRESGMSGLFEYRVRRP